MSKWWKQHKATMALLCSLAIDKQSPLWCFPRLVLQPPDLKWSPFSRRQMAEIATYLLGTSNRPRHRGPLKISMRIMVGAGWKFLDLQKKNVDRYSTRYVTWYVDRYFEDVILQVVCWCLLCNWKAAANWWILAGWVPASQVRLGRRWQLSLHARGVRRRCGNISA